MPDNVPVMQDTGDWALLATSEVGGVHTLRITLDPSNAVLVFLAANGDRVRIATRLTAGVHTLAVTAAP